MKKLPAPKQFSDQEVYLRNREARKRWEARNPEKVAAKKLRDNQKAKEKRAAEKLAKMQAKGETMTTRKCDKCSAIRPLEEFKRHGTNGRKRVCIVCDPVSTNPSHKRQVEWAKRNPERVLESKRKSAAKAKTAKKLPEFVAVRVPKPTPARKSWTNTLESQGWRKVFGESDPNETLVVFIRGLVMMFYKNYVGSYSAGKHRYAVVGDDSGKMYKTLGHAEAAARREMA